VLVAAVGAGIAGWLVLQVLPGGGEPTRWEAILQLAVGGLVIGACYLGLAMALRIREIDDVVGLVRRRLGR
jgi:putative peptidoglycan lipid II flippase